MTQDITSVETAAELNRPAVSIREASREDAASVALVMAASFAEYESSYSPEASAATFISSDEIVRRLGEGPVWVAVRDGEAVGTVSVVSRGESLFVRAMAVLPAARGQRIGELLLNEVESYAAAHGYVRLVLSTTPLFERAIRLYEKFGFRRSTEGPHDFFGMPLFTMEKALRAPDQPAE